MVWPFGGDDDGESVEQRIHELEMDLRTVKAKNSQLEETLEKLPAFIDEVLSVREEYDGDYDMLPEYDRDEHLRGKRTTVTNPCIAWKHADGYVLKLLIPRSTTVVYPKGQGDYGDRQKLRAEKAIVVEIQQPNGGTAPYRSVPSDWDTDFIYEIGETVRPNPETHGDMFQEYTGFDPRTDVTCSGGIHLYRTRQAAKMTM